MAITYASGSGTLITTHAMNENLPASQPTNLLQVRVSDDLTVAGNGQIGDGSNGIGVSYVGRLLIINIAGTQQRRMCVGETDETNTFLLDVHEEWDTQPVGTTDTIHIPYEAADIEDGGAGGGVGYQVRTGLFAFTNDLTIQVGGGLQIMNGTGWEMDDNAANIVFFHQSGGYLYSGYESGGSYINGGEILYVNNAATEPSYQAQSGSVGYCYDLLWWAQLLAQQLEHANGSGIESYGVKFLNFTNELHLYDKVIRDCKVYGKGGTTEIIRVDAGTDCDGLVLSGVDTLQGPATADTKTLKNVNFAGVTDLITLIDSDIWNMINPIWTATLHSDFNSAAVTAAATINDRTEVTATIQEADGTLLQNALVIVYENTVLADLVLELVTDVNGYASDSFIYLAHIWTTGTGATTTYGGHALRIDKWTYYPFVQDLVTADALISSFTVGTDSNIVQTTQATALTDGSGFTWNEDTNPSSIIAFTGGSGGTIGLAVGDTITGVSGATGIVTEIADGDGTAGKIHLKTRNATAYNVAGEVINNGADGWTANMTAASEQPFSIWLDANAKSYQTQHDYWAALTSETTLSATGELVHEWGRGQQARLIYRSGSSFFTERSNSKGVYIVDAGAGTLSYVTDDNGGTFTPSASVTLSVTVLDESTGLAIASTARVYIADTATKTQIMAQAVNGSGVATLAYNYTIDVPVVGWARELDLTGTDYVQKDFSGTITAAGFSQTVALTPIT